MEEPDGACLSSCSHGEGFAIDETRAVYEGDTLQPSSFKLQDSEGGTLRSAITRTVRGAPTYLARTESTDLSAMWRTFNRDGAVSAVRERRHREEADPSLESQPGALHMSLSCARHTRPIDMAYLALPHPGPRTAARPYLCAQARRRYR